VVTDTLRGNRVARCCNADASAAETRVTASTTPARRERIMLALVCCANEVEAGSWMLEGGASPPPKPGAAIYRWLRAMPMVGSGTRLTTLPLKTAPLAMTRESLSMSPLTRPVGRISTVPLATIVPS
jgi:hypothetical protein